MSEALILAEGVLRLWPFILVVAAAMIAVRPTGRLAFFAIGLISFLVVAYTPLAPPSLHGESFVLAFFGLAVCVAAVLAEAAARIISRVRKARSGPGWVE